MSRLLDGEPSVVTTGVALFADALAAQAVDVATVDWRPPLGAGEGIEVDADVREGMAETRLPMRARGRVRRRPLPLLPLPAARLAPQSSRSVRAASD